MRNFMNNIKKAFSTKIFTLIIIVIISGAILSGCMASGKASSKNLPVADIGSEIIKAMDMTEMVKVDEKKLQKLYNINPGEIEDFFVYISSSNIKVQEIAVFKAKDAESVQSIKEKISKRIEKQEISFKDYLPDEYYLIQNHLIKSNGSYILMAVSKNTDKAEDIFDKCFK